MKSRSRAFCLFAGPVLFLICCFLLPSDWFASLKARAAVGTVAWMSFWWVSAPVDYAVTALLPIAINAFIPMENMKTVISNYSSETIMLLLGASILIVSWEKTGLDKRIAIKSLGFIGNNLRTQYAFWFLFSALLSTVLPNAIVCATITPIAVSMLKYAGESNVDKSEKASRLLLYIAYGTGIGGLASPLGGAMNLVIVDYLQQITGKEYMYMAWVVRFLPIMFVLIVSNIFFMLRKVEKNESLEGSQSFFKTESKTLSPASAEEKIVFLLFITATILSFLRPLYSNVLPGLKPAFVFITCAILSFLVTDKNGNRLIAWKSVQSKIVWELIFVFAGGLAMGSIIQGSGAAKSIGLALNSLGLTGGLFTIFVIITATLLLSDITSNTATAAISLPIVISVVKEMGLNPIPWIYITSIGVNLSYILPTSIRAIPVGYGLSPSYMFKEGWKLSVIVIILMTLISYIMLKYWPAFSTCNSLI